MTPSPTPDMNGWVVIPADVDTSVAPFDGSRLNLGWMAAGGFDEHVELGRFVTGKGWCNTYGHPFSGVPDYFQRLPKLPVTL